MTWPMPLALVMAPAVCWCAAPPAAGAPLDVAEFERLTTGKTFFYTRNGQSYGAEQYLPGRRVVWAFTGDDCLKGTWFPVGDSICFVYDGKPDPQCWRFAEGGGGLEARYAGDPSGLPLIARQSSPEPMACMGPDVGV